MLPSCFLHIKSLYSVMITKTELRNIILDIGYYPVIEVSEFEGTYDVFIKGSTTTLHTSRKRYTADKARYTLSWWVAELKNEGLLG